MNNYKIVIDASHGGEDIGVTGNNIVEKDYSLLISNYIYNKLKNMGYDVSISRINDEELSNENRIDKILSFYGDDNVIIISNHLSDTNNNVEIIYALRNSNLLSNYIADAMKNEGINVSKVYQRRLPSDPIKDYYFIHRDTKNAIPILISYGNVTNEADNLRNYEKYGDAVVSGIINYINNSGDNAYIVKSGDSLYSISRKYGVSVDDIKRANNLNTNLLQIGQRLKIPSSQDESYINYVVKSGDSLYSIARKYDTTVSEIMNVNNLKTNLLSIGQKLLIPNKNVYVVKSGDSLWSIAKKYNTTVDDIKNKNNLTSNILSIGQSLVI